MDSTATSNLIISKYHWFDRFLAGLCILFGLFMIAGMGATTSVSVRTIDASMGLLTKEVSYFAKNINKITRLMGSIDTSAQFAVAIVADFAKIVSEIAILAFKTILQAIVKSMLASLGAALNSFLSGIKSWIKTLSALLDTVKSFLSAIAMKVFALGECNINRSADVISGFLGVSQTKANSATSNACGGKEPTAPTGGGEESSKGGDFAVTGSDASNALEPILTANGITAADAQGLTNALSSLRISIMLSHVNNQSFVNNSGSGKGASDGGNSTAKSKITLSKSEIDTKKADLAYAMAISACDTSKSSTPITSVLDPRSYTVFNSECTQKTAEASEQISRVTAADIEYYDKAEKNAIQSAPPACGFQGYTSPTKATKYEGGDATTGSPSLKYDALSNVIPISPSFSATAIDFAAGFNASVVSNDQCDSAKQSDTILASANTQVAANNKPQNVDSAAEGAIQALLQSTIDSLINGIQLLFTNFINEVFTLAVEVVNKFTSSLPGGEFLSSSLTGALNSANTDAQNTITRGLNSLKGSN